MDAEDYGQHIGYRYAYEGGYADKRNLRPEGRIFNHDEQRCGMRGCASRRPGAGRDQPERYPQPDALTFLDRVHRRDGLCDTDLRCQHLRCWDKERQIFDPRHYLRLAQRKPGSLDHALPLEELDLPECFWDLRRRLESEREDGSREFIGVLRLLENQSLEALTAAVQKGLRLRAHSRDAIAQFLLPQEPWAQTTFRLDGREHLRQVKVAVADIRAYAELLASSPSWVAHGGGQA